MERSLNELRSLQQKLIVERTAVQLGGTVGPIPPAIISTAGFYDLGIDVTSNQVAVYADEPGQSLLDAFEQRHGDVVRVQGGVTDPLCTRTDCRYTMRGGLALQPVCTSSFTAFTSTAYYTLSAGHCSRDTGRYDRSHAGVSFGTVNLRLTQNRVDAERIIRQNSVWYMSASILVETTDIRPIYHHISWESTAVNTFVGKSGKTTGTTRGYITDKDFSPSYITNNPERFIVVDACAEGGGIAVRQSSGTTPPTASSRVVRSSAAPTGSSSTGTSSTQCRCSRSVSYLPDGPWIPSQTQSAGL